MGDSKAFARAFGALRDTEKPLGYHATLDGDTVVVERLACPAAGWPNGPGPWSTELDAVAALALHYESVAVGLRHAQAMASGVTAAAISAAADLAYEKRMVVMQELGRRYRGAR